MLDFIGENFVKYMDAVLGGEVIKMMVRLFGGPNYTIISLIIVFKNYSRSYPRRGVTEKVPGASYRNLHKARMERKFWTESFSEAHIF